LTVERDSVATKKAGDELTVIVCCACISSTTPDWYWCACSHYTLRRMLQIHTPTYKQ